MKTLPIAASFVLSAALGCASSQPTPELLDARRAYETARTNPDARYTPDRVLEAKQALDRAEYAHRDDPGSDSEKGLAYIAERRAELAVVYGQYERDRRDRAGAEASYKAREDELRRKAEGTAAAERRELQGARETIGTMQTDLATEQAARQKAEKTAAAALASLNQIAKVKEDQRGTVITLDGSVLFVSGKSELLPIARQKLDEVANALNQSDDPIMIEGYTDSQGNADTNLRLSQDRADSVRAYLEQKGVKQERLQSIGKGASNPIASNATPEGRANNRRVEIIVQKRSSP